MITAFEKIAYAGETITALSPRPTQRPNRRIDRHRPADGRHDLGHVVADLVQLEDLGGDGFAQLAVAGGVGVEGVAGQRRLGRRVDR